MQTYNTRKSPDSQMHYQKMDWIIERMSSSNAFWKFRFFSLCNYCNCSRFWIYNDLSRWCQLLSQRFPSDPTWFPFLLVKPLSAHSQGFEGYRPHCRQGLSAWWSECHRPHPQLVSGDPSAWKSSGTVGDYVLTLTRRSMTTGNAGSSLSQPGSRAGHAGLRVTYWQVDVS